MIELVILHGKVFSQDSELKYLSTGLPVCYINYPADSVISREQKLDVEIIIQTSNDTVKYQAQISGRGNATWYTYKKPYNLKFDNKVSLLGIRPCKKYALMANAYDPSLCRIAVGFKLGELLNFDWYLQGVYVELVLNGIHQGNYFLAQRISQNTIPYNKDSGCILEYRYTNQLKEDEVYFFSSIQNWIFGFKDPDDPEIGGTIYTNAIQKLNQFEEGVFTENNNQDPEWYSLIDWNNYVKWYYWKNILQMDECNRYYVIEDNKLDTKMKMGPLWDFDWTIGLSPNEHYEGSYFRNKLFFQKIGRDSLFLHQVATYHFANRERLENELNQLYDSLTNLLDYSATLDAQIWNTFADSLSSWKMELEIDRTYLTNTFRFLDQNLAPYLSTAINNLHADEPKVIKKWLNHNHIEITTPKISYHVAGERIQ